MFIIFGWQKESEYIKPLLDTYCYHCNSDRTWDLCCETEWVTFFYVKTLAFNKNHFIVCEKCHDTIDLDKKMAKKVNKLQSLGKRQSKKLHDNLVLKMETHQLANKTKRQIDYIKSIRSSNQD